MPGPGRVAALVALLGTLAACSGTGGSTGNPGGVAESYLHDLADANYAPACQLLTDDLRGRFGDCPAALARHRTGLPVGEVDELRLVTVDHVTYHGKDNATVYAQDIRIRTTATVNVHGTPKPRGGAVRSIAANHATDGHGLELTRSGGVWRISGGGV